MMSSWRVIVNEGFLKTVVCAAVLFDVSRWLRTEEKFAGKSYESLQWFSVCFAGPYAG